MHGRTGARSHLMAIAFVSVTVLYNLFRGQR